MPRLAIAFAAVAMIAMAPPGLAAEETTLPARKAGIWELTTSMDEGVGPREQTMKICIGAEMEANTVSASIAEHKQSCARYEIKKSESGTVVDAECVFNGRNVTSETEMSGDFASAFSIKISSTTSDEKPGGKQTIVVRRRITQNGKYLGESCGDLKPGEAMAADGTKVLVQ